MCLVQSVINTSKQKNGHNRRTVLTFFQQLLNFLTMVPVSSSESTLMVVVLILPAALECSVCSTWRWRESNIRGGRNPQTGTRCCLLGKNGEDTFESQEERNCSQKQQQGEQEDGNVDLKGERRERVLHLMHRERNFKT